jgi:hypothetical protein
MAGVAPGSDREFVEELRRRVERYLAAVDQWESAYQKYYRLPGYASRISGDLEAEQRAYQDRRRELEEMVPRGRRLCWKHGLRDPFTGLLRISLGFHSPQERRDSVIGRNERNVVATCLVTLSDACREWDELDAKPAPARGRESLLKRVVDFFF